MTDAASRRHLFRETAASSPSLLYLYTPLLVVQTLLGVALPFALGSFLDGFVYGSSFPTRAFLLYAAFCLGRLLLEPLLQRFLLRTSRALERNLQDRILDRILAFPPADVEALPLGEIVAKITRDAGAMGSFIRGFYPKLVIAAVTLLAASGSLFLKSCALGIGFLLILPLSWLLFRPYSATFRRVYHAIRTRTDGAFNHLFEFFHILPFLQALAAEKAFSCIPRQALDRVKRENEFSDELATNFEFASRALLVVGEVCVLGFAGWLAWRGRIPIGNIVVCQMLFLTAIQAVLGVVYLLPQASSIREGSDSLCELLGRTAPNPEANAERRMEPGTPIRLDCDDVSFSYVPSRPVLEHLTVSIPAGSIVGISGANGAGKTTLLKLLMGILQPCKGTVRVDGRPLAEWDLESFRKRIGIVFQDNLLYTGTIRDNITLRNPKYDDSEVQEALTLSGASEVVARMPQGLRTLLTNAGPSLSGGERQKIAIARALLRAPGLLVLDEVTNHLDMESRASFCTLLDRFRGKKTVLLVSHDPDVLRRCDFEITLQHICHEP